MHLTSFSFKLKICKGKRIKNGSIINPTLTRLGCIELDFLGDFLGHGWLDLGVFGCFFWLSFSFLHVNIIHIYIKKKNPTLPTNSSLSCVFRLIWIWVLYYYYYFFLYFLLFFFFWNVVFQDRTFSSQTRLKQGFMSNIYLTIFPKTKIKFLYCWCTIFTTNDN